MGDHVRKWLEEKLQSYEEDLQKQRLRVKQTQEQLEASLYWTARCEALVVWLKDMLDGPPADCPECGVPVTFRGGAS